MKMPTKQKEKYKLIGKRVEFLEGGKIIRGKVAGFGSERIIVVTQDELSGIEIEEEDILRIKRYGK